jgi:hypothetical protein
LAYKNGNYYLYHKDSLANENYNDSSEMIWYVMKYLDGEKGENEKPPKKQLGASQQMYALEAGEVVKFGRVSYKITRIYHPMSSQNGPIINEGGGNKMR